MQAKRLEELDALYRDEAIMRKKIFNQVHRRGRQNALGLHGRLPCLPNAHRGGVDFMPP